LQSQEWTQNCIIGFGSASGILTIIILVICYLFSQWYCDKKKITAGSGNRNASMFLLCYFFFFLLQSTYKIYIYIYLFYFLIGAIGI